MPPGSKGRVVGMCEQDASYEVIVHWEENTAFVMPAPIQATYSKREAATAFRVVE